MHQGWRKLNLTPVLGGIHKDSSGKLWSIYLAEADDHDQEITELWKGEADSILVFVSVLSIVELYPSKGNYEDGSLCLRHRDLPQYEL